LPFRTGRWRKGLKKKGDKREETVERRQTKKRKKVAQRPPVSSADNLEQKKGGAPRPAASCTKSAGIGIAGLFFVYVGKIVRVARKKIRLQGTPRSEAKPAPIPQIARGRAKELADEVRFLGGKVRRV